MSLTLLFAGGGSLGHVTPSLAVAEHVQKLQPDTRIVFVTSPRGDEQTLVRNAGHELHTLTAPKFPRGITYQFLTFPFAFTLCIFRSFRLLHDISPDVVFSKGGFISVPIAFAAWIKKIPFVLHTSDVVLNASDRLLMTRAAKVCTGFPMGNLLLPHLHTGNPVRSNILEGWKDAGQRITGFSGKRPVLMVIGGSQGSLALNRAVERQLHVLLELVDIIHFTGRGKFIATQHARYFAKEEVTDDLAHLYALSDLVVTRAGAGVLSELAALHKAAIVVPLTGVAHDHQLKNTEYLIAAGAVFHLPEESLGDLTMVVTSLMRDETMRHSLGQALSTCFPNNAALKVAEVLLDVCAYGR